MQHRIEELIEESLKLPIVEPRDPIPEGVEVIGIMPDFVKPMRMLFLRIEQDLRDLREELQYAQTNRRHAELVGKTAKKLSDLTQVHVSMGADLGGHFGEYHFNGYGVGEGWQVWAHIAPTEEEIHLN